MLSRLKFIAKPGLQVYLSYPPPLTPSNRASLYSTANTDYRLLVRVGYRLKRLWLCRACVLRVWYVEDEACRKHLSELKCHVTCQSRTESRLSSEADKAELLNTELTRDIRRLLQHVYHVLTYLFTYFITYAVHALARCHWWYKAERTWQLTEITDRL